MAVPRGGQTTMNENELFRRVVQHLGEFLEADLSHLEMGSRLSTALPGLDSLKLFEMVLYLEDCFGLQFDESVMQSIETVRDLVTYISGQLSQGVAQA
jgi:acyl carrier protein